VTRGPDPDYLVHFQARVIQDALAEAEAAYWRRRAAMFEGARPRPEDYTGQAAPAELAAQDARCAATAAACRARAALTRTGHQP
jgi:hypothetical protein